MVITKDVKPLNQQGAVKLFLIANLIAFLFKNYKFEVIGYHITHLT